MSISGVLGFLITAGLLYNVFFSSKEQFFECVKYYLTPDVWSFLKGEFQNDFFAEFRLLLWLGLSAAMGAAVHHFFI